MGDAFTENSMQLGELLLSKGFVTAEQIEDVLAEQGVKGYEKLFGELLVDKGYCTDDQIASAQAQAYGVPYAQVGPKLCDGKVLEILPREFLEKHLVLPLFKVHDLLTVAVSEPTNVFLIDEIERLTGCKVQTVCATVKDIKNTIRIHLPAANIFVIDDIIDEHKLQDFALIEDISEDIADLEQAAGQLPVVKLVNYLIYNAVKENASDIHIEPDEARLRVRYRVDGNLYEKMSPPYQMHSAIVSKIKIMAGLDKDQTQLPQDGAIRVLIGGRAVDLKVSIMKTNFGQKVVIKVINPQNIIFNLESLGFAYKTLQLYRKVMNSPNGIILVTGPADSGKNTTLYATLSELNTEDVNICTVENPVEFNIFGINQFQVNQGMGFDCSTALRSLLRQDPDIIMVDEIRDEASAAAAIQAALTGRLVFSTLHTEDAPSAVTRLMDLGVPPFLVSASLTAVLAQRLARKICPSCKAEFVPPASVKTVVTQMGGQIEKYYQGVGCRECRNTGFFGRIAVHELFLPDERIKQMINQAAGPKKLRQQALKDGMVPLHLDGVEKVKAGIIPVEEVLRLAQPPGF